MLECNQRAFIEGALSVPPLDQVYLARRDLPCLEGSKILFFFRFFGLVWAFFWFLFGFFWFFLGNTNISKKKQIISLGIIGFFHKTINIMQEITGFSSISDPKTRYSLHNTDTFNKKPIISLGIICFLKKVSILCKK